MPIKINGAPKYAFTGISSEKIKQAKTEAITGSPRGTEATAVGVKYLITQFNTLCPKTVGTRPKNRNQQKCSKLKPNKGTAKIIATSAMVKAATKNNERPYITLLVFFRILEAKTYVMAIHTPLNKEKKFP